MVRRGSGGEPLQGILKLLLVVLAASMLVLDTGRVVAQEQPRVIEIAEDMGTQILKHMSKSQKVSMENRQRFKGGYWTSKGYTKAKKHLPYIMPPPATVLVDRIVIEGGSPASLLVLWADITATATAAVIEGSGCAYQTRVLNRATISLFGTGGASGQLGPFPGAKYWACPAPLTGVGAWRAAVLGLGRGGELAFRFPTFSYQVLREDLSLYSNTLVWLGPRPWPTTPAPITVGLTSSSDPRFLNRYYVPVTGIQIGALLLPATGFTYLSTTDPFTYLEKNLYISLKSVLIFPNVNPVTPPASQRGDQLCYSAGAVNWRSLPSIAVVFNNDMATAMVVDWNNLWYRDGPNHDCLAILPSPDQVSVLGGLLQSGRMMTISRQLGGTTLTF